MRVCWWGVWEPGSSFRPACASCMPRHAKLNRYRREAAAPGRVLRSAHARTYAARRIAPRMGRGAPPSAMRRMPRHTQAGITAPGPARKHSNRRMMYAVTCAARHIRTASHAISRNGPVLIADTHSGRARKRRMRIQNRDAPGRTTPHTRFPTHMLANNPSSAQPVRKHSRPGTHPTSR